MPTPLQYALIGMVIAEPRSGYALRKVFETSPIGRFSSSPGSIYPALQKLVGSKLLQKKSSDRSRGKQLYHATNAGRDALEAWVTGSVSLEEVAKDIDLVLLRFAFHEALDDGQSTIDFLQSFVTAVRNHLANLKLFMTQPDGQSLSLHGQLAMENGIAGYEAQLSWAERAITRFSKQGQSND